MLNNGASYILVKKDSNSRTKRFLGAALMAVSLAVLSLQAGFVLNANAQDNPVTAPITTQESPLPSASSIVSPSPLMSPEASASASASVAPSASPSNPPITSPEVKLSVSPSIAEIGSSVIVDWSNIPNPTIYDWIGAYTMGAANSAFLDWHYVSCLKTPTLAFSTGSCSSIVPLNTPAGTYELRLFSNNSFDLLAISNSLTIVIPEEEEETPDPSPSASPSAQPSVSPSPSASPSVAPSASPSSASSALPSAEPSVIPSPSIEPSASPSATPSIEPSATPLASATAASNSSNGGGSSNGGSVSAPSCDTQAPKSAPKILSAVSTGNNEVTLTWEKAEGPVSHYVITYGLETNKPLYGNPNVGNVTSYTVKGLSGGSTYFFKVRASNDCKPGEFSNEVAVKAGGQTISIPAQGFKPGVLGKATNAINPVESTPAPSIAPATITNPQQANTGLLGKIFNFFAGLFN